MYKLIWEVVLPKFVYKSTYAHNLSNAFSMSMITGPGRATLIETAGSIFNYSQQLKCCRLFGSGTELLSSQNDVCVYVFVDTFEQSFLKHRIHCYHQADRPAGFRPVLVLPQFGKKLIFYPLSTQQRHVKCGE